MIQLLQIVGGLATTWMQGKAEEVKVKQEVKIKAMQSEENWEKMMAEGSKTSWKDEWFVIVLSIPMIGSFVPWFVPHMQEGFLVLGNMPDYYKAFLGSAIAASFGIKALSKWK